MSSQALMTWKAHSRGLTRAAITNPAAVSFDISSLMLVDGAPEIERERFRSTEAVVPLLRKIADCVGLPRILPCGETDKATSSYQKKSKKRFIEKKSKKSFIEKKNQKKVLLK
jgi:alpha-beta hydrolase superfamily lysophospholipase